MAAAGGRDQFTGNIFHRDVSAIGFRCAGPPIFPAMIFPPAVASVTRAVQVFRLDIPAAGHDVHAVILRNVQFDGYPQPPGRAPLQALPAKIDAVGRRVRADQETFQQLLGILLRSVRFQKYRVIYFSGILRLDDDVAEVGYQVEALAVARCHRAGQCGAQSRCGGVRPLRFFRTIGGCLSRGREAEPQ